MGSDGTIHRDGDIAYCELLVLLTREESKIRCEVRIVGVIAFKSRSLVSTDQSLRCIDTRQKKLGYVVIIMDG